MSPDSETESCGSGTMAPEWEPDKTADLIIGTLTSPAAWHHCVAVFQNNTCNICRHHLLLAFG